MFSTFGGSNGHDPTANKWFLKFLGVVSFCWRIVQSLLRVFEVLEIEKNDLGWGGCFWGKKAPVVIRDNTQRDLRDSR